MMFPAIRTAIIFVVAVWCGICFGQNTNPSGANDDVNTTWWQVEVIVFTQGTNAATTAEIWPTDVQLSYPDEWQQLTPLVDPNATPDDDAALTPSANTPNQAGTVASDVTPAEDDAQTLDPGIIKLLPEEDLQLTEIRKRVSRGQRRVLFHGAWRQYMERYQEEAPIIFTAGDQFDDHFELEGSIHIYYQRLLHFDVNLWLTEFSINTGQEHQPWPELPRRPNMEIPVGNLADLDVATDLTNNPVFSDRNNQNNGFGTGNTSRRGNSIGTINTLEWFDQRGNTTFYDTRYDEILSRNYVINNLALIQQDRPMRSEELHYIDHPLLGILVKIIRYTPPEPESTQEVPLDDILGP